MSQRTHALLAPWIVLWSGCSTSLAPENPYDPAAPGPVQAPATISGRVVAEVPIDLTDAVLVAEGTGVLGAADSGGSFEISVVAGQHIVRIEAPDHFASSPMQVSLEPGDRLELGDVSLRAHRGTVAGTATLIDRQEHSGTLVTINGAAAFGFTASDGSFELPDVPVGVHQVLFLHDGYATRAVNAVTVSRDETTTVDVSLPRAVADFTINGGASFTRATAVSLELFGTNEPWLQASENPAFTGATWEAFNATTGTHPFVLSSGDGVKTVYARFSPDMVTTGPTLRASIVLDTTVPVIDSLIVGDDSGYVTHVAGQDSLTVLASDLLSGVVDMRVATDGVLDDESWSTFQNLQTITVANPSVDGPKSIVVEVRDAAHNVSAQQTANVVLDTVDPTGTLTVDGQPAAVTTRDITLALSGVSSDVVAVLLSNTPGLPDATSVSPAATVPWTLTAGDGSKRVFARLVDGAGRTSTDLETQVELDTTGPAVPDLFRTDISDTSITLAWTTPPDGDLSHFILERRVDASTVFSVVASPTSSDTTFQDTAVVTGSSYTYRIFSVDALGNVSPPSLSVPAGIPIEPVAATYFPPAVDDGIVRWSRPVGTSLILGTYTWETPDAATRDASVPINGQSLDVPALDSGAIRFNQRLVLRNINPDFSLSWETELRFGSERTTIERLPFFGHPEDTDADVDDNGVLHVVVKYFNGSEGRYLRVDGADVTAASLPTANAGPYRIAADASGAAHIAYLDESNQRLTYVYVPAGGAPAAPIVLDDSGITGTALDIDTNASGEAHVAYRDYTGDGLKHVLVDADCRDGNPACVPTSQDKTTGAGSYVSIRVDPKGGAHIAYHTSQELRYLKLGDTPKTLFANGQGQGYTSIDVDASGIPHISYIHNTNPKELRYVRVDADCMSGACSDILIDTLGNYSGNFDQRLVVDPTGSGVLLYFNPSTDDLRMAVADDACFDSTLGECSPPLTLWYAESHPLGVAMEDSGHVRVVYGDPVRGRLSQMRLERRLPSRYVDDVATQWGFLGILSGNSAIRADAQGVAHIIYDESVGPVGMKYRKMDGVSDPIVLDDSVDGMGRSMSLDIDSQGVVHAAYMDHTNDQLRYATITDGTPSATTVDPDQAGCFATLRLDSTDTPNLTYCYPSSGSSVCTDPCSQVRHLEVGGAGPTTIATSATGIYFPMMALSADTPVVTWVEGLETTSAINSVVVDGSSPPQTLDAADPNIFIATATDSAGVVHVAYHSTSLEGIVLQEVGTGTQPVLLAKTDDIGLGMSMAFDPSDIPHLVWYSIVDFTLVFLRGDGISQPRALEQVRSLAFLIPISSIDVDDQGKTHISFFSRRNGYQLRYLTGTFPQSLTPVRVDKL